jgi:drug/metabolite transporter (DMT)-like permease
MSTQTGIPSRLLLIGAAAAFVLSWSSGFIIAKISTDQAPALTVLVWRFLVMAGILLAAVALSALGGRTPRLPAWRDIRPHLAIGLFAQFGYILPIYLAVGAGVSVGTTALTDAIQPLVVATLAGPLLGLRVRALQWAGLVLGALGVVLIVLADASASLSLAPAHLLPLVALASLVAATFLDRRTASRLTVSGTLATHAAVTLVAVTLLAALTGTLVPPASLAFWVSTVLTAVLPGLVAYALYWYLLRRVGITALNALLYLVAPTTAVVGSALVGDPFTPATLAGLLLGALAITLVIKPERKKLPMPAWEPGARPAGRRAR